jgi:nucleotide sugar dehydrogenase
VSKVKVGIVGHGYVGKAMERLFEGRCEIVVYDPKYKDYDPRQPWPQPVKAEVCKCDLAIICVPTPMSEDGSCDTSIVFEVMKWLWEVPNILIKSTVPPGTIDKLVGMYPVPNIVFSPEYIGEGNYYVPPEYMHPTEVVRHPFQIFGGKPEATAAMIDIFVPVMGPHVFFYQVPAKCAELIKYWENTWGAMKVTFANEMYEICNALGVDFWQAREGWALDNRVEKMHSAVFADKRGFGGKCYPKDVNALVKCAESAGYDPRLIREVLASNERFRGGKDAE